MKLDKLAISVNSRGMVFFKPTWSQIALIIIYSIIVLAMVGYIWGGKTGKHLPSNNQQVSLQVTPITSLQPTIPDLPTPPPTLTKPVISLTTEPTEATITSLYPLPTVNMAIADWKTYISSDGSYSFRYPPKWLMAEGMLNGGETGVDVNGPEGDFSIVIPSMPVPTCEGDTQQVRLKRQIIVACDQINPNGSETWNAMVQEPSSTKKFSIQAIAAAPTQNNRALLLKIFSTLIFQ